MPLPPIKISATGTYVMGVGSFDEAYVNGVSLTISGLTGSVTVQKQQALGNITGFTPTAYNCSYINANTDAYQSAGTAITADGQYLVSATAAVVLLNVTAVTGSFTVVVTPVEGAVGATSAGGGGGGSGTIVPVMVQDPTGAYTQPTMDAASRAGFVAAQGQVADGATASGVTSVLVGSPDSGGLMRTPQSNLASATPISTADYGYTVNANLRGLSSANTLRPLVTASGFTPLGSAASSLTTVDIRAVTATTYEQVYNNRDVTWLTSAARTTLQTLADATNQNYKGVAVFVDVTAFTSNLTVTVNIKDPQSAKYFPVGSMTVTGTGSWLLIVYPGIGTGTGNNTYVNAPVTRTFNATISGSATYTAGYSPIL